MATLIDTRPAPIDIGALVEQDRVHRSVYTDPAIFDLEMQRIWGASWIYVGHESQVKEPGDYYATTIGKQPVVLTRHSDGAIYVLYNRCAHKGALVVGDRCGKAKELRCGYHGWRFDFDGKLLGIPLEQGYDGTRFDRKSADASMRRVARADSYRGFVFASLSDHAPDLKTWLSGVASSIDNMVDRAPEGALEITGGVMRYEHDCNWKFFVENLNDMMHPMVAHQSSSLTARVVAKKELSPDAPVPSAIEIIAPFTESYSFFDDMGVHAFAYGHGYSGGKNSIHAKYSDIPEYNRLMEEAYGKDRVDEIMKINRHNTILYPSATIKGAIQTMRVVRPVAVDRTIIESWTFRLKGAPDALLQRSILYCNLINSSANLVGPDDQEAYRRQHLGLQSIGSDWVLMHRDFGRDEEIEPGHFYAKGSSDISFRNQYRAWKHYMTGEER
jgi:phenylpropionate dioxygenase-like ring-hydroxylating dioxygenase large terminal subunit